MAQVAACNRLHELEQRLARWLLMCQDRVDSEMLYLTHEFLAQMLGTGRPSVSLAVGMLEHAGFIENIRGTIKVINRKALGRLRLRVLPRHPTLQWWARPEVTTPSPPFLSVRCRTDILFPPRITYAH